MNDTVRADSIDWSLQKFGIGQPVPRTEDPKLVRGEGRYTDDINLPGQAHAVVVRSRHAHGIIRAIDIEAARAMPGVLGVYTGSDLQGYGALKCIVAFKNRDGSPMHKPVRHTLAADKVRFVGDPVAVVVAETLLQAKDAADAVDLEIEALPAVTKLTEAAAPDAPQLYEDVPRNVALDFHYGDAEKVAAAFESAAHVAKLSLVNSRVVVSATHPLLRHRAPGVLQDAHLAERRHAGRKVDHEVRRAGARNTGRQRVRRESRREPAGRRHRLLRARVVREREQDDAVVAGAIRVVGKAPAVPRMADRNRRDAVLERPRGSQVGRERADDLAERMAPVDRHRRALVAQDLRAGRWHDRAVARSGRVLRQPPQAVRGMAPHLSANEQLGRALGVGRARANVLRDVAREAQGLGCRDLGHRAWMLGRDPMGERRRARFCDACHRVPNARLPSIAPRSRRASRAT